MGSGSHANLPFHFYVNVKNSFLGPDMPEGVTPGIWHGVYSREAQVLMCHVLLESGANWSGLPLHALSFTHDFRFSSEHLMPWGAMGTETVVWSSRYLHGLACEVHAPIAAHGRHTGLVIDWADGFSRYPQEHKPLNLVLLEAGQFALLPNNYLTYKDAHFVDPDARANLKHYRRGETVYWEKT
jgi:hypothetical protein